MKIGVYGSCGDGYPRLPLLGYIDGDMPALRIRSLATPGSAAQSSHCRFENARGGEQERVLTRVKCGCNADASAVAKRVRLQIMIEYRSRCLDISV